MKEIILMTGVTNCWKRQKDRGVIFIPNSVSTFTLVDYNRKQKKSLATYCTVVSTVSDLPPNALFSRSRPVAHFFLLKIQTRCDLSPSVKSINCLILWKAGGGYLVGLGL